MNIVSVINRQSIPLSVRLIYRDLAGQTRSEVRAQIEANLKWDYIVNDMPGFELNSYGTVCAFTDASASGAWSGNIIVYKADTRNNPRPMFGSGFDYALSYPFTNPLVGPLTLPLNTFRLGMPENDLVANWIALTDAVPNDGRNLRGTLYYFDENGAVASTMPVSIVDGGRTDYPGHVGLGGSTARQAVGLVQFVPEANEAVSYYMTLTRYFYEGSPGAAQPDLRTAFVIPERPATGLTLTGGASTKGGVISIVEMTNVSTRPVNTAVQVFSGTGTNLGSVTYQVPPRGTRHAILNRNGETGFLANEVEASAQVLAGDGQLGSRSLFYRLDERGALVYAYAAAMNATDEVVQLSQYNSFIDQTNTLELTNTGSRNLTLDISALRFNGQLVFHQSVSLPAFGTTQLLLNTPRDEYGTVIMQSSQPGFIARSLTSRIGEYAIPNRAE